MTKTEDLIKDIIKYCEALEGEIIIKKPIDGVDFLDFNKKIKIPRGEYVILATDERDKNYVVISNDSGKLFSIKKDIAKKLKI